MRIFENDQRDPDVLAGHCPLAELGDRVAVFYQGAMAGELSGGRLGGHELLEAVNTGQVREAA